MLGQGHAVRVLVVNENVKWKKRSLSIENRNLPIDAPTATSIYVSPDAMMRRQVQVLEYFQRKPGKTKIFIKKKIFTNSHLKKITPFIFKQIHIKKFFSNKFSI